MTQEPNRNVDEADLRAAVEHELRRTDAKIAAILEIAADAIIALDADPDEQVNVAGLPEAQVSLEGFRAGLRSMLRPRRTRDERTAGPVESRHRRE